MPFHTFEQRHFSDAEMQEIRETLNQLRTLLSPKFANLSAEERTRMGSINEQNKLFAIKVKNYQERDPHLSSPDVDWEEFKRDFTSRDFIEGLLESLEGIMEPMQSAKILHDYDVYQNALVDYDYTKYKANTSSPGFNTKLNEIKQFFPRTGKKGLGAEAEMETENEIFNNEE